MHFAGIKRLRIKIERTTLVCGFRSRDERRCSDKTLCSSQQPTRALPPQGDHDEARKIATRFGR
jgi:hypothetical protein